MVLTDEWVEVLAKYEGGWFQWVDAVSNSGSMLVMFSKPEGVDRQIKLFSEKPNEVVKYLIGSLQRLKDENEEQLNKPTTKDMLKMVPDSFAPGLLRVSTINRA